MKLNRISTLISARSRSRDSTRLPQTASRWGLPSGRSFFLNSATEVILFLLATSLTLDDTKPNSPKSHFRRAFAYFVILQWGPSINDVCTGGGSPKAENTTDRLLECDSKFLKMLQTSFMDGPMLRPPARDVRMPKRCADWHRRVRRTE